MTRDDDIERVLDRWFTEGPTQMPSRFFNETFDRIDRTPEPHSAQGIPRISLSSRKVRLAAAAAVVVAVAGVAGAFLNQTSSVGVVASPSPTPPTAPTIDPTSIQTKWTSVGPRPNPDPVDPATKEATFMLDERSLAVDAFYCPVESAWSLAGPDNRLVLRTLPTNPKALGHWDCEAGQEGIYTLTLSSDGDVMTLSLEDRCLPDTSVDPRGQLEPMAVPESVQLVSARAGTGPARRQLRALQRWQRQLRATPVPRWPTRTPCRPAGPSEPYATPLLMRRNDPGTMSVIAILDVAPHTQEATCPDAPDPAAGRTAAAMADWLTRVPGLVASTPAPIEIGGYQGLSIDVSVAQGWTTPDCQFVDGKPIVMTFADPAPLPQGGVFVREAIEGEGHARYILLDVGKGHNLLIEISAPDKASWDDLVQAAMPVVESMQFTVAPGS